MVQQTEIHKSEMEIFSSPCSQSHGRASFAQIVQSFADEVDFVSNAHSPSLDCFLQLFREEDGETET